MSTENTTPATPAKRFALIGEVDGQAIGTGFWRAQDAADKALAAAVELSEQAGITANLRLIPVDNAVLGNPKATAADLLTKLAPAAMKAHDAKVKAAVKRAEAAKAKAADKPAADKPAASKGKAAGKATTPRKRGGKAAAETTAPGGRETVTREPAPKTPAADEKAGA